ncbi:unnamed protein product, partial [Polarella glacialis]
ALHQLGFALRGRGFFVCEDVNLDQGDMTPLLQEAYAASRQFHAAEASRRQRSLSSQWTRGKPNSGPYSRAWFTGANGRRWPRDEDHPGFTTALQSLDARLAAVAAVMAAALACAFPSETFASAPSETMLRALRYAPSTPPAEPEVAITTTNTNNKNNDSNSNNHGIPAHVDFGDFTLCHSDSEGLEAWEREAGLWQPLPAWQICFLAGTALESKTQQAVRAVEHRVLRCPAERLSFCRLHGVSAQNGVSSAQSGSGGTDNNNSNNNNNNNSKNNNYDYNHKNNNSNNNSSNDNSRAEKGDQETSAEELKLG